MIKINLADKANRRGRFMLALSALAFSLSASLSAHAGVHYVAAHYTYYNELKYPARAIVGTYCEGSGCKCEATYSNDGGPEKKMKRLTEEWGVVISYKGSDITIPSHQNLRVNMKFSNQDTTACYIYFITQENESFYTGARLITPDGGWRRAYVRPSLSNYADGSSCLNASPDHEDAINDYNLNKELTAQYNIYEGSDANPELCPMH